MKQSKTGVEGGEKEVNKCSGSSGSGVERSRWWSRSGRFNELSDLPLTMEGEPNLILGSIHIWTYNNK